MNLFNSFKFNKKLISQTQFINSYVVMHKGKEYSVIVTRKIANKLTRIKFVDNTFFWEQLPLFWRLSGKGYLCGDKVAIYKFNGEKNKNTLFVVKGVPGGDEGLDDGIFRSPKKYDENFVNVMTYKKFKSL